MPSSSVTADWNATRARPKSASMQKQRYAKATAPTYCPVLTLVHEPVTDDRGEWGRGSVTAVSVSGL